MKITFTLLLSIITILTFNVSYSQEQEVEVRFLQKSGKVVRLDTLTDDTYSDLQGDDDYFFESIVFRKWNHLHGLKVTKKNYSDDSDELLFYSKNIDGDFVKKKKSGEFVFTLNLMKFNLSCCGEFTYQIIDSYSGEVIKEFKVSQDINGE